jgi:hypothetical protein
MESVLGYAAGFVWHPITQGVFCGINVSLAVVLWRECRREMVLNLLLARIVFQAWSLRRFAIWRPWQEAFAPERQDLDDMLRQPPGRD